MHINLSVWASQDEAKEIRTPDPIDCTRPLAWTMDTLCANCFRVVDECYSTERNSPGSEYHQSPEGKPATPADTVRVVESTDITNITIGL